VLRTLRTIPNHQIKKTRVENEKEREKERSTRAHTNTFAASRIIRVSFTFLAACVRSSAGRLIPVVWSSEGFIYDCL
jgi:hypothetical protein